MEKTLYFQPEGNRVFNLHSEIRAALPHVLFGVVMTDEDLASCGIYPLRSVAPPVDAGQVAVPFVIELIDGEWTQLWTVREMTPEELEAAKPPVPQEVTMRQARLALLAIGKLDQVAPAIESLEGADRNVARIEWEFSGTVARNHSLVAMLGQALGLDEPALDQLFVTAAGL
jgi:hypothetical protein